jgi:hypothetical protein
MAFRNNKFKKGHGDQTSVIFHLGSCCGRVESRPIQQKLKKSLLYALDRKACMDMAAKNISALARN